MKLLIGSRLAALALLFASVVIPVCSAAEDAEAEKRSLGDVILLIQKNQLLKEADLINLTRSELRIARNAVYNRHGKQLYYSSELAVFFADHPWRRPGVPCREKQLTTNDDENIKLIKKAERGTPYRPDNSTIEGAMRLYVDAFFQGDSDTFLTLCHPKYPPRFTGYDIETLKRRKPWIMQRKELEVEFAAKGGTWMDFFGDTHGAAQYRWTVVETLFEEWKKDGELFRHPLHKDIVYVKWQKIDELWYIAEFTDIVC